MADHLLCIPTQYKQCSVDEEQNNLGQVVVHAPGCPSRVCGERTGRRSSVQQARLRWPCVCYRYLPRVTSCKSADSATSVANNAQGGGLRGPLHLYRMYNHTEPRMRLVIDDSASNGGGGHHGGAHACVAAAQVLHKGWQREWGGEDGPERANACIGCIRTYLLYTQHTQHAHTLPSRDMLALVASYFALTNSAHNESGPADPGGEAAGRPVPPPA